MGTKITALPPVITPAGTDELAISQDIGGGSRTTYKATLDQLKDYVKTAGGGTGTITSIGITSTDGSVGVFNSPITSSGTISLTISSVGLDKLDDGGATGGEVLTYNASTNEWEPGYGGSSGIIPNILVGNGGTTYTLIDYTNDTASNYLVFVGGVAQRPTTDFTISGSSIIFGSSIASGVQILVYAVINIASLNVDSTPIGTVSWFAASAAPTSYLECSGGVVAISEYLDLYNVIGKKYNTGGEGASNFRLPDLRGEFIRGWDDGRGVDTGRVFGSLQKGTLYVYDVNSDGVWSTSTKAGEVSVSSLTSVGVDNYNLSDYPNVRASCAVPNQIANLPSGSNDTDQCRSGTTRPRNVALLPCIKAVKTVTGNVSTLNFIEKPASPTSGQVLTYNGSTSTWVASAAPTGSGMITSGTAVSAIGTSIDFTTLPNWVKRVTVLFSNVTLNGSELSVRIGSGSVDSTSTYTGYAVRQGITVPCNYYSFPNSTSLQLTYGLTSDDIYSGIATLCLVGSNIWVSSSYISSSYSHARNNSSAGQKVLSGSLDRIRIGSDDGTSIFTSGTINIMWE